MAPECDGRHANVHIFLARLSRLVFAKRFVPAYDRAEILEFHAVRRHHRVHYRIGEDFIEPWLADSPKLPRLRLGGRIASVHPFQYPSPVDWLRSSHQPPDGMRPIMPGENGYTVTGARLFTNRMQRSQL
jgi:hypothetical protein